MHESVLDWFERHALDQEFEGRTVVEIGSRWIRGGLRPLIWRRQPASYIGYDRTLGPGVDEVCEARDLVDRLGLGSVDTVIATEVMHTAEYWMDVPFAAHQLLKPGGTLFLTTRSPGAPVLDFPIDYWRFEIGDIWRILDGWDVLSMEEDEQIPGVMVKAVRTSAPMADLDEILPQPEQPLPWRPRSRTAQNTRS